MYSDDISIHVENLGKRYSAYAKPQDRLKEAIWGRVSNALGRTPRSMAQDFWALSDVSFDVRKGETVGIVGRNGSGKSTLLQMICGTVTPSQGSIQTHGRVAALLELGAGFNPEFTGRENVYLNASLLGLTHEQIDARFDRIAGFADIGEFIESPVKKYSSGMFARLAFSVAIHTEPDILIVDEILAVGDAAFQRRCLKKFYEIRDAGCTILFVSHDQYQVKSICQRALYLERGKQKAFGPAGRVIDQYTIDMQEALREFEAREEVLTNNQPIALPAELEQLDTSNPEDMPGKDVSSSEGIMPMSEFPAKTAVSEVEPERLYTIEDAWLTNDEGERIEQIATGENLVLNVEYRALTSKLPPETSFVFNLYRHDGLYICGTTTLMDGLAAHASVAAGRFTVRFPKLPLLSGSYKWRVAINDGRGFVVYAEAKDVCQFHVLDNFEAVGVVSLERSWTFESGSSRDAA
ncbi:ABC transporter ATP-binding protein [Achromobacter sp. Marseille-Q4962]|uniref:ABC transporter ATP-binding protein n=1 Tax=Achromobacter sp. Marseille-Q4962 TaxID=2942202 RepID=UPI0020731FC0|nr:ABC transporter ATP-binding protein [Achromobacter sp. Marseille-Q4962]